MKLSLKKQSGLDDGQIDLSCALISDGRGTQAVHDDVVAFQAANRSGTACTKTMGDVAGTGKKPWRQKGTGRARAGSFASPLWRGGGVVFGPKPRDYSKKVNKQTKALALLKSFSERCKAGDVVVVEELNYSKPSTKGLLETLQALGVDGTVLVVADAKGGENLYRSARNIPHVDLYDPTAVNAYALLRNDKIVITKAALTRLETRFMEAKSE